jgi:inosine-uridine nucleoside N-ribohydrolase
MEKKIWLDCDPGHDDMLAIIMAAFSDGCQLVGVSTSAGNSYIENTTQNALNILYEIGRSDIPVIRGSAGPLCRILEVSPNIHGPSGLEGAELLKSPHHAIEEKPFL